MQTLAQCHQHKQRTQQTTDQYGDRVHFVLAVQLIRRHIANK